MERNKFIFYKDWWEALQQMPEEMSRAIIEAIMNYALYGIESDDPQIKYSIYALAKAQIDRDTSKYDEISRKRREAGRKGGAPKGNQNAAKQANQANACFDKQNNQLQANQTNQANNNDSNNDIDNNIDNDKDNNISIEERLKIEEEELRARKKNLKDEEYAKLLMQDQIFWEATAMAIGATSLGWTIDYMKSKVKIFIADVVVSVNDPSKDYSHFRNRFKGWLRAQSDYERKNKKQNQQSQGGPLDDFIAKRLG